MEIRDSDGLTGLEVSARGRKRKEAGGGREDFPALRHSAHVTSDRQRERDFGFLSLRGRGIFFCVSHKCGEAPMKVFSVEV